MPPRRVLLLGATGLVGGEVLQLLLADDSIEHVVVITRRPTGHTHDKLDERILDRGIPGEETSGALRRPKSVTSNEPVNVSEGGATSAAGRAGLGEMEQHRDAFAVDAILCALGTTIRVAKTKEQFRHVDHDLPLLAARLGLANGATHFLLVSSLGADPKSRVFYNRVKGEVEADLLALPYPKITIVRPSFLVGPRPEFRLGEQIVTRLGWLMPPRIKPIEARDVARAMVTLAQREDDGARIVESRELRAVAAGGTV